MSLKLALELSLNRSVSMIQSTNIIPVTDLQGSPAQYIARVHGTSEVILITQRGRSAAMLVDPETYEGMVATIEAMSRPDWQEKLKKAEDESRKGKGVSHEKLKEKIRKARQHSK